MFKSRYIKNWKACILATLFSVSASSVVHAQASDFTTAGTSISNTFTLTYSVSGTAQPQIDNTATPTTFTVDRIVDLTVDYQTNSDDDDVAPGATAEELVFLLRNDGNDNFAYTLSAVNESNAANEFDTNGLSIRYYIDDGDGIYEPGPGDDGTPTDFASATPNLAPDRIIWVEVRGDIPVAQGDGDVSNVSLVADTLFPTAWITEAAPASPGTAIAADDGTNTKDGIADNVLADGSGTANENANEGDHSDTGVFTVAAADISATKTVSVISTNLGGGFDCENGTLVSSEEYAVPGSCVEYIISVVNAGGTNADITLISDTLPDDLTFVGAVFSNFTGGTPAEPAGSTDCDSGACVVSQTGGSVDAGQTATITLRALVN